MGGMGVELMQLTACFGQDCSGQGVVMLALLLVVLVVVKHNHVKIDESG